MIKTGDYDRATERLGELWTERTLKGIENIRVRTDFFYNPEPSEIGPPASRLMRRRGTRAVQLYLACLFVAHCRATARGRRMPTDWPLRRAAAKERAWLDLLPWPAEASTAARTARVGPADNRLRQLKSALKRLSEANLVALTGAPDRANHFENFELMHESGDREGTPIAYDIPKKTSAFIEVPPKFFTNGWVFALEGAELVTYLMFRHLQMRFSRSDPGGTFFRPATERELEYGVKKDAYESHILLHNCSILDHHLDISAPPPSSDPDEKGRHAHLFSLNDDGLDEDGVRAARRALTTDRRAAVFRLKLSNQE